MSMFDFLKKFKASKKAKNKPKLGLALGSGGAKGFAHLGVIKAFEENGVEFDIVGGTSIGAVVGAFYADGYTSTDIENLIMSVKIKDLILGIPYNMDMSGIKSVVEREIGGKNIEELKKPFVAVCCDVDDMVEIDFTSGKVSTAVCGSSCYLPYFKPIIDTEGRRLVDGAYLNSIPSKNVKDLGADFVVGVDLSANTVNTNKRLVGEADNPKELGYKYADVLLDPDLSSFTATSLTSKNEMYAKGYEAAMKKMDEIKEKIANLKTDKKKKKTS